MKIKRVPAKPKPSKYKLTLSEIEYSELRYYLYVLLDEIPNLTEEERKYAAKLYEEMKNNVQS